MKDKENIFTIIAERLAEKKMFSEMREDDPDFTYKNRLELTEKINDLILQLNSTTQEIENLTEEREILVDDILGLENRKHLANKELNTVLAELETETANYYNPNSRFYLFLNTLKDLFKKTKIDIIEDAGRISKDIYHRLSKNPELDNHIIKNILLGFSVYAKTIRTERETAKSSVI